jgi:hypothetical protein
MRQRRMPDPAQPAEPAASGLGDVSPRDPLPSYGVIFTSVPPAPLKGLFFGVFRGSTLKFDT